VATIEVERKAPTRGEIEGAMAKHRPAIGQAAIAAALRRRSPQLTHQERLSQPVEPVPVVQLWREAGRPVVTGCDGVTMKGKGLR
jgi:hypothetical protein